MFWTIVGSTAAALTMFSFIPQIIRVFKRKSAKDVSPVMLFQLSLGVLLWLLYGTHIKNAIIITANLITLLTLIVLLLLYFSYGRKK